MALASPRPFLPTGPSLHSFNKHAFGDSLTSQTLVRHNKTVQSVKREDSVLSTASTGYSETESQAGFNLKAFEKKAKMAMPKALLEDVFQLIREKKLSNPADLKVVVNILKNKSLNTAPLVAFYLSQSPSLFADRFYSCKQNGLLNPEVLTALKDLTLNVFATSLGQPSPTMSCEEALKTLLKRLNNGHLENASPAENAEILVLFSKVIVYSALTAPTEDLLSHFDALRPRLFDLDGTVVASLNKLKDKCLMLNSVRELARQI